MDKIDLFKEIISSEKKISDFTEKGFTYLTLSDNFFNMIGINKKLKIFGSKQEMSEFCILIFLYKYDPKIKRRIEDNLAKNQLFFSKHTDQNLPDVKIGKYWYEISSFNSDRYKYQNSKEFLDETYKKINKNSKFKHLKKNKNSVDLLEVSKYFTNEVYKVIIKKLNKTYIENKKDFKVKKLIIFQAYPIPTYCSEFFLEHLIKKYGEEIHSKIKENVEIFIFFPKSNNQKNTKFSINEYNDKKTKDASPLEPEKNIVIEINENTKKIYEENKIIYPETDFFKLIVNPKNLGLK